MVLLKISAVIPANNEALSVRDVVTACMRHCSEVIVIDDGSTDDTSAESQQAGAILIRNGSRIGIVASVARGMEIATGDIIVTLDADGQHDPSEIERLVKPIADGKADVVLGRRACQLPFTEWIIKRVVNVRVKCVDVGTGYRAVRGELARKMHLWGICLCGSFVLEAHAHGGRVVEVPITIHPRTSGESHWSSASRITTHAKQLIVVLFKISRGTGL